MERSSGAAPPRQLLTFEVEGADGDASIVSLAGELDLSTIPQVEKRLLDQLRSRTSVIVDLTKVTFIDSSGIALLIRADRATKDGVRLHTVISRGSQLDRVFEIAGIGRALPLHLDREAALAAVNGRD